VIAAKTKIRKPPKGKPITWGKMKYLKQIRKSLNSAYQKIVKWKKNYTQISRGKAGKTLIA